MMGNIVLIQAMEKLHINIRIIPLYVETGAYGRKYGKDFTGSLSSMPVVDCAFF